MYLRDIDSIIERVRDRLPSVTITQLQKTHQADDDGIWWFKLPDKEKDIQIESSSGKCPFLIEHDDMQSSSEAVESKDIDVIVEHIVGYLMSLE